MYDNIIILSDQDKTKIIKGFSKLSKMGKLKWLAENFFTDPHKVVDELKGYWHANDDKQELLDGFSENTITNFPMPYGIAPNFLIDGKAYAVPMVIEESSVVAAASSAAKFWMERGGFNTKVLGTIKYGQIHLRYPGNPEVLKSVFPRMKQMLLVEVEDIVSNMKSRGGGVLDIQLKDFTHIEPQYFQFLVSFETCESMGANFINSVLEKMATAIEEILVSMPELDDKDRDVEIIMAILSNYTPECIVRSSVSCRVEELGKFPGGMDAFKFAEKFRMAVRIAEIDPFRATTHNKGIFNGIDAVILATGNDFRAVEAGGHTYAARSGTYRSLSHCEVEDGVFRFWLDIPLAIGTVGGLTSLHPIAKTSLEMLGNPDVQKLMSIIASVGLAQNFAALRSLVTTGIQRGHMKMHLQNILKQLGATEAQKTAAMGYFEDKTVSFSAVRFFLENF